MIDNYIDNERRKHRAIYTGNYLARKPRRQNLF